MSDDPFARLAADQQAYERGEFTGSMGVAIDHGRRRIGVTLGDRLPVIWFTAEECATFMRLAAERDVPALVTQWAAEIAEERADPTGAARLRHIQERQRAEQAAAGTSGQSVYAQELAKFVRLIPDNGTGDPK